MRLGLFERKTCKQPIELTAADRDRPILIRLRPSESTFFQPSIVEPEAVRIPVENLELVQAAITENEHAVIEWIELELKADNRREAIY